MKEDIKCAGIDLHQSACLIEIQDQRGQALAFEVSDPGKRNESRSLLFTAGFTKTAAEGNKETFLKEAKLISSN